MTTSPPITAGDIWTVRRLLGWATEDFRQRGLESPRLEAELLLGHALGKSRIELIVQSEFAPDTIELNQFRDLVRRRRTKEPTAYLVGQREFYGIPIRVDRRVLVPRPDTETLVQVALDRSRHRSAHGHALDLCTGSGCVAIAFARRRAGWNVIGVDISSEALQVAEDNTLRVGNILGLAWLQGDLFEPLSQRRFDLITANPPYIPSAEYLDLDATIRDFEPKLALDGGADGLDVTRRIVQEAPHWLEREAILAVEIAFDQAPAIIDLFQTRGFVDVEYQKDYGGRDRVVSGRWPKVD